MSSLGSQMTFLALPWFVLVTTGSAAKMSIVLAVEILPIALLGIPSGALIARLGARTTMVLGDAGRAPRMLAIPLLHGAGVLTFPLLLVFVFALGILRPKVMTGVITMAMLAGPIGLLTVGPLLAS